MRPALLAPGFALAAVLADAGGVHGLAYWLVLLALPVAAAAAFTGLSDGLEGLGWLSGSSASLALVFLVVGSTVRSGAPTGASIPTVAVSAVVAALICYGLPGLVWLLEPLRLRPRARAARVRTQF